jgi:hypothetical protein
MRITASTRIPRKAVVGDKPRRARSSVFAIVVATALVTGVAGYTISQVPAPGEWFREWSQRHGHGQFGDRRARQLVPLIPQRWWNSESAPQLVLDIKFRHLQTLYRKRSEALSRSVMIQGEDDFVPASIRHAGRTTRVKLRIKGDIREHIRGDRWSFRIHVKGKDHLFGMRRLSIQHPERRAYQAEVLFFETLRHVGVLAPRYFFVDVVMNGNDLGLMAVEEHFSKELLEANGRRDGVIIRLDESLFWAERDLLPRVDWKYGAFDSFRSAPVDAFRSTRVAESPTLARDYEISVGLLRGFAEGRLAPSEVFDVELMGRFLAVAELWESQHSSFWNNKRFYLNPFSLKLEPIGFDADVPGNPSPDGLIGRSEQHTVALLDDPRIFAVYQRTLRRLAADLADGVLLQKLTEAQQRELAVLRGEFYMLEPYPLERLRLRADELASMSREELRRRPVTDAVYPTLVHAYRIDDANEPYLEISNAVPHAIEVQSVHWLSAGDDPPEELRPLGDVEFPLKLPPTLLRELPRPRRIYYEPHESEDPTLELQARIVGQERTYRVAAEPYHPSLGRHPIPEPGVAGLLTRHPFLELDPERQMFSAAPGAWQVRGVLAVPTGFGLRLPPGTTLRFEADGALIARGDLQLEGSAEAPVVLEGLPGGSGDEPWQGVFVLDAARLSRWTHATVRNTSGILHAGLELTGGVTFFESAVEMQECRFIGNRAEDALNLVHSEFRLGDLLFEETRSDALDVDFSDGVIEGGVFRNVGIDGGGDGVDVSGSVVTLEGTQFFDIRDKALSVGERSEVTARRVTVERAATGAASKDGSRLEIRDSKIAATQTAALMAYVKKPEFGPGRIEASGLVFGALVPDARAQIDSVIVIDGRPVEPEDIDVAELYETSMKRGGQ